MLAGAGVAEPAKDCAPRVGCRPCDDLALPPSDAGRLIGDLLTASYLVCAAADWHARGRPAILSRRATARALPPPPPTAVYRKINTSTYLRRMFVTEELASFIGLDAVVALLPGVDWGGASAPTIDVAVLDAGGRVWPCTFTLREGSTVTGQLGGAWRAFCGAHGARPGHAAVFERAPPGWQGSGLAVRARIV